MAWRNAVDIDRSAFRLTPTSTGTPVQPSLGFTSLQDAVGEGAVADFLAYDTLGIPVNVRVTAVLESLTDNVRPSTAGSPNRATTAPSPATTSRSARG